jgi:hypothetical protein
MSTSVIEVEEALVIIVRVNVSRGSDSACLVASIMGFTPSVAAEVHFSHRTRYEFHSLNRTNRPQKKREVPDRRHGTSSSSPLRVQVRQVSAGGQVCRYSVTDERVNYLIECFIRVRVRVRVYFLYQLCHLALPSHHMLHVELLSIASRKIGGNHTRLQ